MQSNLSSFHRYNLHGVAWASMGLFKFAQLDKSPGKVIVITTGSHIFTSSYTLKKLIKGHRPLLINFRPGWFINFPKNFRNHYIHTFDAPAGLLTSPQAGLLTPGRLLTSVEYTDLHK